jgi:hypothetical protein
MAGDPQLEAMNHESGHIRAVSEISLSGQSYLSGMSPVRASLFRAFLTTVHRSLPTGLSAFLTTNHYSLTTGPSAFLTTNHYSPTTAFTHPHPFFETHPPYNFLPTPHAVL